jgi:hypothetical protein
METQVTEKKQKLVSILFSAESAARFADTDPPNEEMAKWITDKLGKEFVSLIGARMATAAKDASTYPSEMERLSEDFRTAFRAIGRAYTKHRSKDYTVYPIRCQMLRIASEIVKEKHRRPTKVEIRRVLEAMGYGFTGKNANHTWSDHFSAVKLDRLE